MALKIDSKIERKLTCAFKNGLKSWQIFVYRLKNSNFILETQSK